MRTAAITWCAEIPGLQTYLFRRISDDLVKNHIEGPKGFRAMLAPWVNDGFVTMVEDEIRFWNGSKIYLCHCKDEKDRFKYLGAEMHLLLIDELTTFTSVIYRFLRSRVRAVGLNLPDKYRNAFPRILASSNPGNVGHLWVKASFVDPKQPRELWQTPDSEGGMLRQFLPAKLEDNPSMATDDPNYRQRLRGLGNPELVRAMEEGDWNVIAGAFFPEFETARHVIRPFALPDEWAKLRAMDWGSARPFSVGWYAIADGDVLPEFPRGAIVKYREWYGSTGEPNVGLKLDAGTVANGIAQREAEDVGLRYGVLDPAAFAEDGGPSIAERMNSVLLHAKRPSFRRADNARVGARGAMGGWDQLRARLVGQDGKPMLYFFDTCRDTIRTLPALQHDEARPEDLDTEGEDHAADETRYACMSRPYVPMKAPEPAKAHVYEGQPDGTIKTTFTFNHLRDMARKAREGADI